MKQIVLIGITLFSMFFGAGNLIFSPWLGFQAGTNSLPALLGFCLTAVVCPIVAVTIISNYDNGTEMISKLNRKLAIAFMTVIYLLIGPAISIPRTATTSLEMMGWFLPANLNMVYITIFFLLAMLTAWKPGRLKDILGKVMGPILVVLVLVLCTSALLKPAHPSLPNPPYAASPFVTGFNDGYQTMDILAAFCFGRVLLLNIQGNSDEERRTILKRGGILTGILLAGIYALLALASSHDAATYAGITNGAGILARMAETSFGMAGQVLISAIFFLACFNVCSGLLSCCSEYFVQVTKKGTYLGWLVLFTVAGIVVSASGLDAILAVSAPVLTWICPVALAFLAWGAWHTFKEKRNGIQK